METGARIRDHPGAGCCCIRAQEVVVRHHEEGARGQGAERRLDRVESKGAGRSSIRNAGRYIGWLERGLVYTVIVAGMPGGVAVVMAVKTAARFPQFEKEERFVEYYLIGTLASLAIALAAALGARAVLGLSPFD